MKWTRLAILSLVLLGLAAPASATPRIRLVGISVGAGYSHFSGYPGWYGPYGYGYGFSPWGYSPYLSPWYAPALYPDAFYNVARAADKGEVRLKTPYDNADVYIDGAYAGSARKLKSIWLKAGVYEVELRPDNQAPIGKKIYVLTGKTLDLRLGEAHR